jgi:separase
LSLDISRIHAAQCLNAVTSLEREIYPSSDLLSWPTVETSHLRDTITANNFQSEFVDIIPGPWTAVSMSLNEDCSELFVSRYRYGQSPLILRLPFSRQKSEDTEDDMFDYEIGNAELADIIQLSNYSCHSSVETNVKGAKTNWWTEREALDLRLQELLINIENIWLGGFRGVFSQHERDVDQLNRFRKAFDTILGRHLPSRRAPKRGVKSLALDDQVLELFIGLGSDQDGEIDLDEPLSDLLYFVVDMLQFNGERNAYDEVDFDSMSIEVLDALRSYHDSVGETSKDSHLILVLDRRLHAFPWESLPCLQTSSVSRVDSMLTLRDRILEMRSVAKSEAGRHIVSKRTGSYILNPGGDLKGTESTMAPELSKLAKESAEGWTSIVRREPSEDEFKRMLSISATMMYFGHGSGAQYIRPRAIRKLDKCSEVVWLMGCSSGAVQENDELEPYAVPLAYMAAGGQYELPVSKTNTKSQGKCMAVLATLWDVTDKDIDRFSLAVGEEWGLWRPPPESIKLPVKTPKKRVIAAPVTPQKGAKTPKTPRVKQTPAAPKTPARSQSRQPAERAGKRSLMEAVAKSRDACYLRYLNGAAPVVYGVPVYLGE